MDVADAVIERIHAAPTLGAAAARAVEELAALPHFSWIGIYWVDGDELVLGAWRGPEPTVHTRIPIGQGICGAAAASGRTEVVDDVMSDPRYLACFPTTRSEIVVPIRGRDGRVVGEIDVDSDRPAAFGPQDVAMLEAIADALGERCER